MLTAASSNQEPLILAIETATRAGSVAVTRGETLLSCREGDASISHSTNLIEMIDLVLNEVGAQLSDVDVFAVAVGPGSFTGLRIGLATVKAFAEVNQRPIVGISTLAAVAHAEPRPERPERGADPASAPARLSRGLLRPSNAGNGTPTHCRPSA